MRDENGEKMSEDHILKEAIELMSEVCCLLYETQKPESHAAAIMADSLIKYLQVISRNDDVLLAFADYSKYEEDIYIKSGKHLRLIK